MEFQVALTPRAEKDLEQIGIHIAKDNPERAQLFCDELMEEEESLHLIPQRGHQIGRRRGIHKLFYGNYLIIYKIETASQTVEILRFWHGARDRNRLRLKEEAVAYAAVQAIS